MEPRGDVMVARVQERGRLAIGLDMTDSNEFNMCVRSAEDQVTLVTVLNMFCFSNIFHLVKM